MQQATKKIYEKNGALIFSHVVGDCIPVQEALLPPGYLRRAAPCSSHPPYLALGTSHNHVLDAVYVFAYGQQRYPGTGIPLRLVSRPPRSAGTTVQKDCGWCGDQAEMVTQ